MVTFFVLAHFFRNMNMQSIQSLEQSQIEVVATFLIMSIACLNILFVIKVKSLVLIKWSYMAPQWCWLLSLEWSSYFEHAVQPFLKHMSSWYPFLSRATPNHLRLKYRCSINISNQTKARLPHLIGHNPSVTGHMMVRSFGFPSLIWDTFHRFLHTDL